jgi:hypothetical protein
MMRPSLWLHSSKAYETLHPFSMALVRSPIFARTPKEPSGAYLLRWHWPWWCALWHPSWEGLVPP